MLPLLAALKTHAQPKRVPLLQRFFRTGPGEYAHGDVFIGLTVPTIRSLVRQSPPLPLADIKMLLQHPWHEARFAALCLLMRTYKKSSRAEQKKITAFYVRHRAFVNNWDLVDVSAPHLLGAECITTNNTDILTRLATSKKLFDRRIAVIATHAFIRRGDGKEALRLCTLLLHDTHDLMHKAIGWTLREIGKRQPALLWQFLVAHAYEMPSVMFSYATEKLDREHKTAAKAMRRR